MDAQVQIIRSKSDPNYKPPYTTVSKCVAATIRENGFKGPFQGLGATILRNTPANAVYLGTFEVLKNTAAKQLSCKVSRQLWDVFGEVWGVDQAAAPLQQAVLVQKQQHCHYACGKTLPSTLILVCC